MCHVSHFMLHLSPKHVTCPLSPVTCHLSPVNLSPTPTDTATDPPPANSGYRIVIQIVSNLDLNGQTICSFHALFAYLNFRKKYKII